MKIALDSPALPDNYLHYELVKTSATINATPIVGSFPLAVQFTGSSSGSPTSWAWKFGDGGTSTQQNPQHTYTSAGTFAVELTATNAYGSTKATTEITARAPGTPGGYLLDGFGGLHPFKVGTGATPAPATGVAYWPGWNIARGVAVLPNGTGGYTLDGFGGVHPFKVGTGGPNPPTNNGVGYWPGWDIARAMTILPNGTGGYVLDGFGGIHPFALGSNPKPPAVVGNPYWLGLDVARGITLTADGSGGFVVDVNGGMHPFKVGTGGTLPEAPKGNAWIPGLIRGGSLVADGTGGFTVDAYGGMHDFRVGSGATPPPAIGVPYWPGWDIARDIALVRD